MIVRLMRVAIQQNTVHRGAQSRATRTRRSPRSRTLREDVDAIVRREGGRRGERVAQAVDERFASAKFPFLGDRLIPRIAVQSTAGEVSLETGVTQPEAVDARTRSAS